MIDPIKLRLAQGTEVQFQKGIMRTTLRFWDRNNHMQNDELIAVYSTVVLDGLWRIILTSNPAATSKQLEDYLSACAQRIAGDEHLQATKKAAGHD